MNGHEILLFLPPEIYSEVTLSRKSDFENGILKKLRECAGSHAHEYFSGVRLEDNDENDPEFQKSLSLNEIAKTNPDALSIWKQGEIRLFISHRDNHKQIANELATALEEFGISSFVAHDTIQPMRSWQVEILKALETMEIMLAFITDDFHESVWTNQEIGYALGRNVPIVPLKLQKKDPQGFIAPHQALRSNFETPWQSASELYKLLAKSLGKEGRVQSALVTAFTKANSYSEAKRTFDRLKKVVFVLSEEELSSIVKAFQKNDQLHGCVHLTSHYDRLVKFIEATTGKVCRIEGTKIVFPADEEEPPF